MNSNPQGAKERVLQVYPSVTKSYNNCGVNSHWTLHAGNVEIGRAYCGAMSDQPVWDDAATRLPTSGPEPQPIPYISLVSTIGIRLNDHLLEMKPGYDDSIVGFNEAWDIVRQTLKEFSVAPPVAPEEQPLDLHLWLAQTANLLNLYQHGYCPKDVARDLLAKIEHNWPGLLDEIPERTTP